MLHHFVQHLREFCQKPTPLSLRQLAAAARDLERWGRQYAEEALRAEGWQQCESALEIPFLGSTLRQQLLLSLLKPIDTSHIQPGYRELLARPQSRPANPFPLADFLSLAGQFGGTDTGHDSVMDRLHRFDPSARPEPISLRKAIGDDVLRRERATITTDLRVWLGQLHKQKHHLTEGTQLVAKSHAIAALVVPDRREPHGSESEGRGRARNSGTNPSSRT